MYKMDPSLVSKHFAHDHTLFRRLASGRCKPITAVNSGRLVTTFDNERLDAAAVVWCLHYGNWPKYPLAVVDGDPHNLTLENIFPVRLGWVRYRERIVAGKYYHPLSKLPWRNEQECRNSWVYFACEHYRKDLGFVLKQEADERELRAKSNLPNPVLIDYERRKAARDKARAARFGERVPVVAPKRPATVPGRVWHYYKKQWLSVLPPVHVSDDCRRRCCATLRGAVRSEYQPLYDQTWYFDAAGEVVKPLSYEEFVAKPKS